MINGIQGVRIANLRKATQVKQSGYKTSIHALPIKVHSRLDWFLNCRVSSMDCLRKLCAEFPGISLPSYKAVENYRKRYHGRLNNLVEYEKKMKMMGIKVQQLQQVQC